MLPAKYQISLDLTDLRFLNCPRNRTVLGVFTMHTNLYLKMNSDNH